VGIVARAAARGLPVIHLSTDYVYVGTKTAPYREDDPFGPINVYFASKAAGDNAVKAENPAHRVLRVSWVFGVYGTNFVKTMLRLGCEQRELRIVADQIGGPTEARDIADAILTMAAACCRSAFSAWGPTIFPVRRAPAGTNSRTRFLHVRVRQRRGFIMPIESRDYRTIPRRRNSSLDCSRIRRIFNLEQPDWRISLSPRP